MSLDLFSYPPVANPSHSPAHDALFSTSARDGYTSLQDHSLAGFCDFDSSFGKTLASVEVPALGAFAPMNPTTFNTTLPGAPPTIANPSASYSPTSNPAPFGRLEQPRSGFSFDGGSHAPESAMSPQSQYLQTPFCSDSPLQSQAPSSPEPSQHPKRKRNPTYGGDKMSKEPVVERPQRKRGRPRRDRSNSGCYPRQPHNLVERKYREGLNSELERLRRAVPTLPQCEGGAMGQPKPSKAMVLAAAIDYIKKVEKERDMDREINERLRRIR